MNRGFVYLGWRAQESKHEEKSEGERERFLYLISASSVGNVRNVLEDLSRTDAGLHIRPRVRSLLKHTRTGQSSL